MKRYGISNSEWKRIKSNILGDEVYVSEEIRPYITESGDPTKIKMISQNCHLL